MSAKSGGKFDSKQAQGIMHMDKASYLQEDNDLSEKKMSIKMAYLHTWAQGGVRLGIKSNIGFFGPCCAEGGVIQYWIIKLLGGNYI